MRSKQPRRRKMVVQRQARCRPTRPNEAWSLDFAHEALSTGQTFRALTVMDVFTREGLAIEVGQRLRGLLALNLSVAAAGAMVIVNTVVIVRGVLGLPEDDVAVALGCFGGGSMMAALLLPRVLDRLPDRTVMLPAAALLGVVSLAFAAATWSGTIGWAALLVTWALLGIGYSAVQTPTGRLLRRSAREEDRPSPVRGPVRALACLLAPDLSPGGLARTRGRHPDDPGGARAGDPARLRPGGPALARGRSRGDHACPPGPAAESSARAGASGSRPRPCVHDRRPAPTLARTGEGTLAASPDQGFPTFRQSDGFNVEHPTEDLGLAGAAFLSATVFPFKSEVRTPRPGTEEPHKRMFRGNPER